MLKSLIAHPLMTKMSYLISFKNLNEGKSSLYLNHLELDLISSYMYFILYLKADKTGGIQSTRFPQDLKAQEWSTIFSINIPKEKLRK